MQPGARLGMWLWPVLLVAISGGKLLADGPAHPAPASSASTLCRHGGQRPADCLTIITAPNASTAGQVVAISGRLEAPNPGGAVVRLWRRFPGARRFHATEATRTGRLGRYSFKARIDTNRWWYVTARGYRSATVHQRVADDITLAASQTLVAPGDQVVFTGGAVPSHSGEQVVLQALGPGGWKPVAQGRLNRSSRFSLGYAFPALGTYQLRLYLRWNAANINSYSAPVTVEVNPLVTLAASETRAAPGDQVAFTGAVSPPHSGQQVVLQALESGAWQPIGQGVLGPASSFSVTYAFPAGGTYQVRAGVQWSAQSVSYSPPVTVDVQEIFKIK